MMIDTVLFDLDGTLLPMDQEEFVNMYLGLMAKHMAPYGYEPKHLAAAIWAGTHAMVQNDGSRTNEEVFWADFCHIFGENAAHRNARINRKLQAFAQKKAMEHYGWDVERFIKEFYKNYL